MPLVGAGAQPRALTSSCPGPLLARRADVILVMGMNGSVVDLVSPHPRTTILMVAPEGPGSHRGNMMGWDLNRASARSLITSVLMLGLATSCSSIAVVPPPRPPITDPHAAPAPPLVPPTEGAESMNTEYYLPSAEAEQLMFKRFAQEIQAIQTKQAADRDQPIQRGFHAKHHGCLHGTLRLLPNRDPRTRYGIFAGPREEFPVWVRLSNGVGWKQHDGEWDARGMAVKVMEVEGPKLLDDEAHTQDFLMTNSPVPIGRNAVHFMRFANANARGFWSAIWFAVTHPVSGLPGIQRAGSIRDLVAEQYWSGGAYHLGAHQAIKYTVKSCEKLPEVEVDDDDPDYLRKALKIHAAAGLCFRLYVQFQTNPLDTPIECASVVWEEDESRLVPVAELILPPQDIDESGRALFSQGISFNPWHSIVAHQPMGHINRARRYVYEASAYFRKRGAEPEPYHGPRKD